MKKFLLPLLIISAISITGFVSAISGSNLGSTIETLPKNYWNRSGAELTPKTANDDIDIGTGSYYGDGSTLTGIVDEKVKISSADTTAGYLENKLVAGFGITLTKQNPGVNENIRISTPAWYEPPVDGWYDPTGGLPPTPALGDRYIADGSGSGWTSDYIYEWDGDSWVEYSPEEGWIVWDLFDMILWFFFSGGWEEVGYDSYWSIDTAQTLLTGDKSGSFNLTTTGTGTFGAGGVLGIDAATNTAGILKFWSAGDNDFYTTFTAGTQTADATYTLPTASTDGYLKNTSGTLSWSSVDLTGYVPYTGATGAVNLGAQNLTTTGTITGNYYTSKAGIDIDYVTKPIKLVAGSTLNLVAEAGNVNAGVQRYWVTFYTALGETSADVTSGGTPYVTTDAGHGKVDVSLEISSDPRVIGRRVYRSGVGGSTTNVFLIQDIPNNTDVVWRDNLPDSSLGTASHYWYPDTTNRGITVDGNRGLILDPLITLFGYGAGSSTMNQGGGHIIIGAGAGAKLTIASQNVLVGNTAGAALTEGGSNVLVGPYAGEAITTGGGNACVGRSACTSGTWYNAVVGYQALMNVVGNGYNVAIGKSAGKGGSGATARYAVYIGSDAGVAITTGNFNTFIGFQAGNSVTTGAQNILIGYDVDASAAGASYELNIGNLIKGSYTSGSEYLTLPFDKPFYFGIANDAQVNFNGSGLIVQSDVVTATDYLQLRGGTNGIDFNIGATEKMSLLADGLLVSDKIYFTQTDGNEYIDSLNDGFLDIGATTSIRIKNILQTENAIYFTQTDGAEKIDSDADGDIDYYAGTSHDFIIGSTEKMTLTASGLAMGSGAAIKLPDYTTVSSPSEGMIAYDFTNHLVVYCYNGVNWLAIGATPP